MRKTTLTDHDAAKRAAQYLLRKGWRPMPKLPPSAADPGKSSGFGLRNWTPKRHAGSSGKDLARRIACGFEVIRQLRPAIERND